MNPGIIASIAAIGVFCFTIGLSYPLLALILEDMGTSSSLIGFNAAMGPIGIILTAPLIPSLARRFGAWFFCFIGFCISALALLLLGLFRDVMIWFGLRFLLGVAINVIFIVSETWINQLAEPHTRGRTIGLYNTIAAAGFALGPLTLAVIGFSGWLPFLIGVSGILIALPVLVYAKKHLPQFDGREYSSVISFLSLAPLLLLAVVSAALFDQTALTLLPIYGLQHSLGEATVSFMLAVLIVGNVVLQIPIGWLADRISRRILLVSLACGAVAASLLLPGLIGGSMLLWPMQWTSEVASTHSLAGIEGHRSVGRYCVCQQLSSALGTQQRQPRPTLPAEPGTLPILRAALRTPHHRSPIPSRATVTAV